MSKHKKPKNMRNSDWESVENPSLTERELAQLRPATAVLPEAFLRAVREGRVGRPRAAQPKQPVSLRLDADVLAAFRESGAGWQARMNEILRAHMP